MNIDLNIRNPLLAPISFSGILLFSSKPIQSHQCPSTQNSSLQSLPCQMIFLLDSFPNLSKLFEPYLSEFEAGQSFNAIRLSALLQTGSIASIAEHLEPSSFMSFFAQTLLFRSSESFDHLIRVKSWRFCRRCEPPLILVSSFPEPSFSC